MPVVDRTGEPAVDGSVPVGDGAEDRDETEESSFEGEAADPGGREPAGGTDRALTSATTTGFSRSAACMALPPPKVVATAAVPHAPGTPATAMRASAGRGRRFLVMCGSCWSKFALNQC